MTVGITQLLLILLIILVLFGAGKLPQVMFDLGKGLKLFRLGMKEDANTLNHNPDSEIEDKTKKDL